MPSVELSKLPGISAPRALATGDRAQIAAPGAAATGTARGLASAAGISLEVTPAAVDAGAAPPVNADRVDQIRAALRDGSYPLVPTRIVDAMIAAQVSLSLPDQG